MKNQFDDINEIKEKKRSIQKQIIKCTQNMLHGCLVTLYPRCSNKNCSCHSGTKKHSPKYYLSVYGRKSTKMHYLSKNLTKSSLLTPRLKAFERYWQLGKQLAELNLALYKKNSFTKRRRQNHAH